jgi:hypothetical protein
MLRADYFEGKVKMSESRNRLFATTLALATGIALVGCSPTQDGDPLPPPASQIFKASFNLAAGAVPYPTDLFFAPSAAAPLPDGTLNAPAIPYRPAAMTAAINSQDGWSTTADMTTGFTLPIQASTLSGTTVRLVELYLSNTTKGPAQGAELPPGVESPVRRILAYGTDYTASVSADVDSGGKFLLISPLKPLTPSSGATNIGYLVILTTGIQALSGAVASPDDFYAAIKSAPADCSSFTDPTQNGVCRLTKGQLAIAAAVGTPAESVVLTWSFSTQSVDDTFGVLAQFVPGTTISVAATGLTTKTLIPDLPGIASIYAGTTVVPYYLAAPTGPNDRVILSTSWKAAGPSPVPGLDPDSRNITRFNPFPGATTALTIPVLVTVPNAGANAAGGGCPRPPAGWPVVIFQHGYPRDRTDALLIADSFANACFILAAIDLPLHGITDPANPLYDAANERTFNVDLVNNGATSVAIPDGIIDPTGTHFLNLASPATLRDNYREAEADLLVFTKTIASLDVTGDAVPDVDPARIHLVGLSNGGIVGAAVVKFSPTLRTATLADAGGVLTKTALDSPRQGPPIRAALGAQGLVDNSWVFNQYFRDAQAVLDSADPINHIAGAQQRRPLHMTKIVGDTNVPNSAFDRLTAAGGLTRLSAAGPTAVTAGTGRYVSISEGEHGSLIYPIASLAATIELQTQTVTFAASAAAGDPVIVITNTDVIEP